MVPRDPRSRTRPPAHSPEPAIVVTGRPRITTPMSGSPARLARWTPGLHAGAVALAAAVAAWSLVAVGLQTGLISPFGPPRTAELIRYGLPLLLLLGMVFEERLAASPYVRVAAAWSALVAAALYAGSLAGHDPLQLLAVPAASVSALVLSRRPALGVALVFLISGTFGSLVAFWTFPIEKAANLALAGLWLGLLLSLALAPRRTRIQITPAAVLLLGYFAITAAQILLDEQPSLGVQSFQTSGWFMLAVLLVAYGGWASRTHERLARSIILIVGLVGGYATYRWIVGPAPEEVSVASTAFNLVGGKMRVIGSFPTGQDLGGWTALVIPFCLAFALTVRGRWRTAAIAGMALCMVALVGSQLRIALLAVLVGAAFVIVLHVASRSAPGLRLGTAAGAVALSALLGVGAFLLTGGSTDETTHSYSSLLKPTRNDPSVDQRLYKWEQALRDLTGHPFGYGVGSASAYQRGTRRFQENVGSADIDNGYLKVALEQGAAVAVLFAAALILLTIELARHGLQARARLPSGLAIGAAGTLAAFLVLLTAGSFQDGPRALAVWLIVGIGWSHFARRPAGEPSLTTGRGTALTVRS